MFFDTEKLKVVVVLEEYGDFTIVFSNREVKILSLDRFSEKLGDTLPFKTIIEDGKFLDGIRWLDSLGWPEYNVIISPELLWNICEELE